MVLSRQQTVRTHMPALDGVRGLAILVVLVHNVGYFDEPADSLLIKLIRVAFGGGWMGVQLFFVLSGFLITGILLDSKRTADYFRSFYIRRTLRIFPIYYLTLIGAFFVLPRMVDTGDWELHANDVQVWYWVYLSNWTDPFLGPLPGLSHFWSLAVEEQFYLLWPFAVLVLSSRALMRFCGLLVVSALLTRMFMYWLGAPVDAIYVLTITRWDALAIGAVIAIAMRQPECYSRLLGWIRRAALPAFVLLLCIGVFEQSLTWRSAPMLTFGFSVLAVLCAWCVLAAIDPDSPSRFIQRVASTKLLRFFGKYSYGMYVFHYPIHKAGEFLLTGWVVSGSGAERPVRLLIYVIGILAVSTGIAVMSYYLVERRFLALKDRWARRVPALEAEPGLRRD